MPENQISTTLSGGYSGCEVIKDDSYYSYGGYEYNPDLGYYEYVEGHMENDSWTERLSALAFDIGWRTRIPGANLELGVTLMNVLNLGVDLTYCFSDPAYDPVLVALNVSGIAGVAPAPNYGLSGGLVTNIAMNRAAASDIVLAAYYQFFHSKLLDNDYYYASYRTPSEHSLYLYAGLEFALDNGTVMAPGLSYTYFLNADYQPHLISAGLTVKFGGAANKKLEKAVPADVAAAYHDAVPEETAAYEGAFNEDEYTAGASPSEYQALEYYVSAASKKIAEKRIREASELLDEGLTGYPGNYEMSLMQGFCMVKLGRKSSALRYYSDALGFNPYNSDMKATVAALKAELAAQKTLKSNTPEYYAAVAAKKININDMAGASRALESGLKLFPGDYEMSLMQGFCMARLGKKKSAYTHYRNALTLDPDNIGLKASVNELWKEIKGK